MSPSAPAFFRYLTPRRIVDACRQSIHAHPLTWLLGGLLTLRCCMILLVPLDLTPGESYYWDWSRQLGYEESGRPPLIAWINWLSTTMLGGNEFSVRLPAVLLGTFGLVWVYLLGAKLFSFRVGLYSIILLALTPGQAALSFLMTTDVLFLFCWVAALYCFWMMTCEINPRGIWYVSTVLFLTLGILARPAMLAFFPLAGLFLLVSCRNMLLLFSVRIWLTLLASLTALLTTSQIKLLKEWGLWWQEAAFDHMHSVSYVDRLSEACKFFLGQMGVISPVLWFVVLITLVGGFRYFSRLRDEERYLICFSGVPLLAVALFSFFQRLEPNWPAVCYPAGIILATSTLLGRSTLVDIFKKREQKLSWSLHGGVICTCLTYLAVTAVPASSLAGSSLDITSRLRGWKELAMQFEVLRQQQGLEGEKLLIVATAGRDISSALAFYLPDQPFVSFWSTQSGLLKDQQAIWKRSGRTAYTRIVVIAPTETPLPESLTGTSAAWNTLGELSVDLGNQKQRRYQVYQASLSRSGKGLTPVERTATQKPAAGAPEPAEQSKVQ